jgi:hypothetical protein
MNVPTIVPRVRDSNRDGPGGSVRDHVAIWDRTLQLEKEETDADPIKAGLAIRPQSSVLHVSGHKFIRDLRAVRRLFERGYLSYITVNAIVYRPWV